MKPIVKYKRVVSTHIEVGSGVWVYTSDHPLHIGAKTLYTSRVISIHKNGDFETMNSIYREEVEEPEKTNE